MIMGDVLKKDRECLRCERFFECKGKPEGVKRCIKFVERNAYADGSRKEWMDKTS